MASSAMVLKLGVFEFYQPHTHKHTQNKCAHDLCAPYSLLRVFIFTLGPRLMHVTYAPDKPQLIWLQENPKTPNLSLDRKIYHLTLHEGYCARFDDRTHCGFLWPSQKKKQWHRSRFSNALLIFPFHSIDLQLISITNLVHLQHILSLKKMQYIIKGGISANSCRAF